jgi:hypothetical protein
LHEVTDLEELGIRNDVAVLVLGVAVSRRHARNETIETLRSLVELGFGWSLLGRQHKRYGVLLLCEIVSQLNELAVRLISAFSAQNGT